MDLSVFNTIAQHNSWGSQESVSGPGSTLGATETLRAQLPDVFAQLNIRSLVDAPCGDMNWMRHVQYRFERFVGVDLVPSIIEKLRAQQFPAGFHFQAGNIVTDILPAADALLCRDCLVHLPFGAINETKRLWKLAGFRYVMATTFPEHLKNEDCAAGEWRPLNMQAAPFLWPAPDLWIAEATSAYGEKALGVWAL